MSLIDLKKANNTNEWSIKSLQMVDLNKSYNLAAFTIAKYRCQDKIMMKYYSFYNQDKILNEISWGLNTLFSANILTSKNYQFISDLPDPQNHDFNFFRPKLVIQERFLNLIRNCIQIFVLKNIAEKFHKKNKNLPLKDILKYNNPNDDIYNTTSAYLNLTTKGLLSEEIYQLLCKSELNIEKIYLLISIIEFYTHDINKGENYILKDLNTIITTKTKYISCLFKTLINIDDIYTFLTLSIDFKKLVYETFIDLINNKKINESNIDCIEDSLENIQTKEYLDYLLMINHTNFTYKINSVNKGKLRELQNTDAFTFLTIFKKNISYNTILKLSLNKLLTPKNIEIIKHIENEYIQKLNKNFSSDDIPIHDIYEFMLFIHKVDSLNDNALSICKNAGFIQLFNFSSKWFIALEKLSKNKLSEYSFKLVIKNHQLFSIENITKLIQNIPDQFITKNLLNILNIITKEPDAEQILLSYLPYVATTPQLIDDNQVALLYTTSLIIVNSRQAKLSQSYLMFYLNPELINVFCKHNNLIKLLLHLDKKESSQISNLVAENMYFIVSNMLIFTREPIETELNNIDIKSFNKNKWQTIKTMVIEEKPELEIIQYLQSLQLINHELELSGENETEIENLLSCPISRLIMDDPITLSTGITYDSASLQSYINTLGPNSMLRCPTTRQSISRQSIIECKTNQFIKKLIEQYKTVTNHKTLTNRLILSNAEFDCPISNETISDPITLSCSLTCDRSSLNSKSIGLTLTEYMFNNKKVQNQVFSAKQTDVNNATDVNYKNIMHLFITKAMKPLLATNNEKAIQQANTKSINAETTPILSYEEMRSARLAFYTDGNNNNQQGTLITSTTIPSAGLDSLTSNIEINKH